jgi:hypothetical protein
MGGGSGIEDRMGKFCAAFFKLVWGKWLGGGGANCGIIESVGWGRGVEDGDARRLVGGIGSGRKIWVYQKVEAGDGGG